MRIETVRARLARLEPYQLPERPKLYTKAELDEFLVTQLRGVTLKDIYNALGRRGTLGALTTTLSNHRKRHREARGWAIADTSVD